MRRTLITGLRAAIIHILHANSGKGGLMPGDDKSHFVEHLSAPPGGQPRNLHLDALRLSVNARS